MPRGEVFNVWTDRLVVEDCCECGMIFAMPETYKNQRLRDGACFTCPAGHEQMYTRKKDRERELERENEALKARTVATEDQMRAATLEAEGLRLRILKDRQRFANGVCPCCNRSFGNVRRHMANQHPDYDVTRVEVDRVRFACECGKAFESLRGLRTHQGHMRKPNWATQKARYGRHLTKA